MPTELDDLTDEIAMLQLLPEQEASAHGAHLLASCNVTCPRDTSDSIPSICCN
jgi:hypothetical protein